MKQLFSLNFLFFITFSTLFSQNFIFPNQQFHGDVLKTIEVNYDVYDRIDSWQFGKKKEDASLTTYQEFDKNGQFLRVHRMYDNSFTVADAYFTFDENGKYVKGEVGGTGTPKAVIYEFEHNSNGQLETVKMSGAQKGDLRFVYEFVYENGDLIQSKCHQTFRDTFFYEYKISDKKLIKETKKGIDGTLISNKIYEYNDEGFPSKIEFFDGKNKLSNQQFFNYMYDEKGNWIRRLQTDKKTDLRELTARTITYKNDRKSNKISKKELEGIWMIPSGDMSIILINGKSTVQEKTRKRTLKIEGKYNYNPYTGEIGIKMRDHSNPKKFQSDFDGVHLMLTPFDRGEAIYLTKLDEKTLSSTEKYAIDLAFNPMPKTKSYTENGKYGLKSETGKILIAPKYDGLYALTRKAVRAKIGDKYGLVDYAGNLLTEIKYDEIIFRHFGYFRFRIDGKTGLLSPLGEELIPAEYSNLGVIDNRFVKVLINQKEGIRNLKNEEILPVIYNDFRPFRFNRAFAYTGNRRGNSWVNQNFELILDSIRLGQIYPVDVNCFKMQTHEGWGLMDSLGNEILKPQFGHMTNGSAQLVIVEKNEKYGLVNTKGEILTPTIYDAIIPAYRGEYDMKIGSDLRRSEAAAFFRRGNHCGYLDGYGKEFLPKRSPMHGGFFETFEEPDYFRFAYLNYWRKSGLGVSYTEKGQSATATFVTESYSGNTKDWVQNKTQKTDFQIIEIDGRKSYSIVKIENYGYNKIQLIQQVFIPVDESTMLIFTFNCKEDFYTTLYQNFFDILSSIEFLKK